MPPASEPVERESPAPPTPMQTQGRGASMGPAGPAAQAEMRPSGPAEVRPARMDRHRPRWRLRVRLGPLGVFTLAFLFLAGSAVAVAFGQFAASHAAPWISILLSAGAVILTVVALVMRPRSRG